MSPEHISEFMHNKREELAVRSDTSSFFHFYVTTWSNDFTLSHDGMRLKNVFCTVVIFSVTSPFKFLTFAYFQGRLSVKVTVVKYAQMIFAVSRQLSRCSA